MPQSAGAGDRVSAIAPPPLRKLFLLEAGILLAAVLVIVPVGAPLPQSVLIGGGIAWLANAYFARQAFRFRGARHARHIAQSFYRGEAGKFILSAALLAAALAGIRPLSAGAVLLAFAGMHLAHTVCAARLLARRTQSRQ